MDNVESIRARMEARKARRQKDGVVADEKDAMKPTELSVKPVHHSATGNVGHLFTEVDCPHCGAANTFRGDVRGTGQTCQECDKVFDVSYPPEVK